MKIDLSNRVALVSGSSRGLGLGIARALHEAGSRVILNARDPDQLQRAQQSLGEGSAAFAADVRDPARCSELLEFVEATFGRLDILVCNVGSGRSVPPGQETAAEWSRVLDLNLLSATNLLEAAQPALIATQGSVVCISSICGLATLGAPVTYSAAKAALNAVVRGLSAPLGRHGVRINAIAPGNLIFPGSTWEDRLARDPDGVHAMLERDVALRRLGRPEEIASWVVFLTSPYASFTTGAVLTIDGGQIK